MQVFISWSGDASQQVAALLKQWLPEVIQSIRPWLSSKDIGKGDRWSPAIAKKLSETDQGVVIVTPTNIDAPWLNFEAGALAKSLSNAQVRPLLFGLGPSDLSGPLAEFQATEALDRADMLEFMKSLNDQSEQALEQRILERSFARSWDDFSQRVEKIDVGQESSGRRQTRRSQEDILSEVLQRVRGLERRSEQRERDLDRMTEDDGRRYRLRSRDEGDTSRAHREVLEARESMKENLIGRRVTHKDLGPGTILDASIPANPRTPPRVLVEFRKSRESVSLDDVLVEHG